MYYQTTKEGTHVVFRALVRMKKAYCNDEISLSRRELAELNALLEAYTSPATHIHVTLNF